MADTPPTYDPNAGWHRGARPLAHPAGSYGGQPLGSAVSVGGFEYDEAALHDLAEDWNKMADEFKQDREQAGVIIRANGAGLEYASQGNADQVRNSGRALLATLTQREDYCRTMANKFLTALGKYAQAEDRHGSDIKQTGGSL